MKQHDVYVRALNNRYDWKPIAGAARQWLRDRGCGYVELRVDTVDAEFGTNHFSPRAGTLLLNAQYGEAASFYLLLKPAVARAAMASIRRAIGADAARVASLAEVHGATQCRPGCLPPIGSLFDLPLLIDSRLADVPEIFVPSGRPGFAMLVRTRDLLRTEAARIIDSQVNVELPTQVGIEVM